jgi:hypothetical protein
MLVTPGGHDTIYDLSGYDTISFQLAAQAVVFDLDYLNKRQYIVTPGLSGGISVTLMREEANGNRSSIENFVGSQYADVIFANPNTISRTFKGGRQVNHPDGRPGDELRLRTYGNQVVDSGNILSIAGLGSIYYYEFETLEWIDGTPMLFDDGDREWFDVGTGTKIKQPSLLGGDAYYSTATKSDTSNFAGWTLSDFVELANTGSCFYLFTQGDSPRSERKYRSPATDRSKDRTCGRKLPRSKMVRLWHNDRCG